MSATTSVSRGLGSLRLLVTGFGPAARLPGNELVSLTGSRRIPGWDDAGVLRRFQALDWRFGHDLPGEFALVGIDAGRHRAVAVRDPLGRHPLFYGSSGDLVVVGPTAAAVVEHLPRVTLSARWLALSLAGQHAFCSGSPYEQVQEVPAGHALLIRDGTTRLHRYHRFDLGHAGPTRPGEVVRGYRRAFFDAVGRAIEGEGLVAAENSGGLDSASVICAANARGVPDRVGPSFGFEQFTGDVPAMRMVAERAHLEHRLVAPGSWQEYETALRATCSVLGYPPRPGVMFMVSPGVQWVKQRGIAVVLSGWGGDHAVTSAAFGVARELGRRLDLRSLYRFYGRGMPGGARALRAVRAARRPPVPLGQPGQLLAASLLSQDVIHDLGLIPLLDRFYLGWGAYGSVNEYIAEAILPLAQARAAESYALRDVLGVEYRYPMLDARLIQTYLSAPAQEKATAGWGRYLHRRALSGIVPDRILWQRRKNLGDYCWTPDTKDSAPAALGRDELPQPVRELLSPEVKALSGEDLMVVQGVSDWVTSVRGKAWG